LVVRIDERVLDGLVTDVLPTVQNGIITARGLKDLTRGPAAQLASRCSSSPTIAIAPCACARGRPRAVKAFSRSSFCATTWPCARACDWDRQLDFVEVAEGLSAGDEVVVSDMADYQHLSSIRIR
jgi:HlyD family secretion protein